MAAVRANLIHTISTQQARPIRAGRHCRNPTWARCTSCDVSYSDGRDAHRFWHSPGLVWPRCQDFPTTCVGAASKAWFRGQNLAPRAPPARHTPPHPRPMRQRIACFRRAAFHARSFDCFRKHYLLGLDEKVIHCLSLCTTSTVATDLLSPSKPSASQEVGIQVVLRFRENPPRGIPLQCCILKFAVDPVEYPIDARRH